MDIVETSGFKKDLNKLPKDIQRLYVVQLERFANNWKDSRLHVKKIKDLKNAFSFRITRRYRVFFYFQNSETAIFFAIDHRKDAYQNIWTLKEKLQKEKSDALCALLGVGWGTKNHVSAIETKNSYKNIYVPHSQPR